MVRCDAYKVAILSVLCHDSDGAARVAALSEDPEEGAAGEEGARELAEREGVEGEACA